MDYLLLVLKSIYRKCVPLFVRDNAHVIAVKNIIVRKLWGHNAIYDKEFYLEDVEIPAMRSAGVVSNSIMESYNPESVIDIGCGTGALLNSLREKGCQVVGLEYADAALEICREKKLEVYKFNIEKDLYEANRTYDLVISMEVAEHLLETYSDRYIDMLTILSNVIVFTAAPPGQGGTDHVNEQPPTYWISKFEQRGFVLDEKISNSWRNNWKDSNVVPNWYYNNLMVFARYN